MTTPLKPLTGLRGYVDTEPEASAEERLGGAADPRHGSVDPHSTPYPWEQYAGEPHGPYGLDNDLIGFDIASFMLPAQTRADDPTADLQPVTRAAPWPKGVPQTVQPDDVYAQRRQSADIHASNQGASREMLYEPTLQAKQTSWELIDRVDPGESNQAPIPDQIKGSVMGWGSRDRVQSNARQNAYGFDSLHMQRRYADANSGGIPGNYMWMQPSSRPLVKSTPGPAIIPNGQDSPFAGDVPGYSYGTDGAVLQDLPVAYSPSPDPSTAASFTGGTDAPVEWW